MNRSSLGISCVVLVVGLVGLWFGCSGPTKPPYPQNIFGYPFDGDCVGIKLIVSTPSPKTTGTIISLSAQGTCLQGIPEYRFYATVRGKEEWKVLCEWTKTPVCKWDTNTFAAGQYTLQVLARREGQTRDYEGASRIAPYVLTQGKKLCALKELKTEPESPQEVGREIKMTGVPNCLNGAEPEYRYFSRGPGEPKWKVVREWGDDPSFTWKTKGLFSGKYEFQLWSRAKGAMEVEGSKTLAYELQGGPVGACSKAELKIAPEGPIASGKEVKLTATSECSNKAKPEYQFSYRKEKGSWKVVQEWGEDAAFTWKTDGVASGDYEVKVEVRAEGGKSGSEADAMGKVTILDPAGACKELRLRASPSSPQKVGTNVVFTFFPTCIGGGRAEYKISRKDPGGGFALVKDWHTAIRYQWDTKDMASGSHTFKVFIRAKGTKKSYDAVIEEPYSLEK